MGSDGPAVSGRSPSSLDAAAAIPTQSRADRIALLSGALAAVDPPGVVARLSFPSNPRWTGIDDCSIRLDHLPGGWVHATVWPRLWALKTSTRGVPSPADRRREDTMRAAGWRERSQTWELDPSDAAAVGEIVDAIQVVLDASLVSPAVAWVLSPPAPPEPVPNEPPPDEPWVEDATEQDLRERLLRLAGLRGGRILARLPGPSATIALDARRERDSIVVDATSLGLAGAVGGTWRARWTVPTPGSSAARIFEELDGALRLLSPPDSGDRMAVRLEQHDAAQADAQSYVFFAGWLVSLPVALLLGIAAAKLGGPAGLFGVLGQLETGEHAPMGDLVIGGVLVGAVAVDTMLAAASAAWAVDLLSRRFGWRYTTGETLRFAAALAGSVAYFSLVFVAEDAWGLVLAAPWVIWIGTAVLRRLRPGQ